eukprot:1220529-Rhodomonas_salina.3
MVIGMMRPSAAYWYTFGAAVPQLLHDAPARAHPAAHKPHRIPVRPSEHSPPGRQAPGSHR